MWRNQHKRRVSAKGVARSGAYDVDIRGEIGRRSRTSPGYVVAEAINEALNPASAPGKVTRLADMPAEKRAEMERLYGARGGDVHGLRQEEEGQEGRQTMSDRVHGGPGTCVAEVGEEATLTAQLRAWLRCVAERRPNDRWPAALPASATWESAEGDRHVITLARSDLDRLQRIHYRRRRPGARAPTSFSVYLPEGVVEFRATSQEAS